MSDRVYPTNLIGLKWPVVRRTKWLSLTDSAMSTRFSTQQLQQYPLHEWELEYELLRHKQTPSELLTLLGFFNVHGGGFDSFLFTDSEFNTVVNEPMGIGDGHTQDFQVIATYKNSGGVGRPDIIQNFNGVPTFAISGGGSTVHTLGPSGIVHFTTAPALNAVITWSGSFYYRCRFKQQSLPLGEFMDGWWETSDPILIGSVLL